MDILILAAGHGKRMRDLTKATPKPLLRFKEKNLLSYALEIAEAIPAKDIHVNVHYQSDQIIKFINANFPQVKISDESQQILNTGGGIKKVLTQSQDLLILNSDNYWNFDILPDLKSGIDFFNRNTNITNLLFTHSNKEGFDLHLDTNKQIIIPSSHSQYSVPRLSHNKKSLPQKLFKYFSNSRPVEASIHKPNNLWFFLPD